MINLGAQDQIVAYMDSNLAPADEENRGSRTGVLLRFGNAEIHVISKKKNSIALSSTKAEYSALREGRTIAAWLGRVLEELCVHQSPTVIARDNSGAIEWVVRGPAKHFARRKHIDIKHNYIMDMIQRGEVVLAKVECKHMLADFLTRPLESKDVKEAIARCEVFKQLK